MHVLGSIYPFPKNNRRHKFWAVLYSFSMSILIVLVVIIYVGTR